MSDVIAARCANCGAALGGSYCAACGQRERAGRITLRHVAHQAAGELVPVDRGFAYTVVSLLRRPGLVAREYVDGVTVRYTGPAKYFTLLVGAAQIVALRSGVVQSLVSGIVEGYFEAGGQAPGRAEAYAVDFASRYFVSLVAVWVPLFAACTRLLFRRAALNYAEHLVLALYTGAQQIASFVAVAWLAERLHAPALFVAYLAAALAYEAWALRGFTGASPWAAAWRTVAAAFLTVTAGTISLAAALAALAGRFS